jgi:hypothetical protein
MKKRTNVMLTKAGVSYLWAMWCGQRPGSDVRPEAGPTLRGIVESALDGEFGVSVVDFPSARSEAVGLLISTDYWDKLVNNPLGVSVSAYAASALEAYMALHPIPEDVLEKYLEPNKTPGTPSPLVSEELKEAKARITTLEARILAQEETIARSAETIATLTRLLEQERVRPDIQNE